MIPSRYLGLQVGRKTGRVYGLVNPDSDAELRDPSLLELGTENGERVRLVRVARRKVGKQITPEQILAIVTGYEKERAKWLSHCRKLR